MDRILSARVDEAVHRQIGLLAKRLKTSKKAIIERAILAYAAQVEQQQGVDVFEQTLGAWQRDESPVETAAQAREAFRRSMERRQG